MTGLEFMSYSDAPAPVAYPLTAGSAHFRLLQGFRILAFLMLCLCIGSPLGAATKKAASSTTKKPVAKTTAKKTSTTVKKPSVKKSASRPARKSSVRSSSRRRSTRTVRARGQQQPTSDRYREIQQALRDAGHLDQEPTGKWDDATVDAMKRFQKAHSLQPSGKINAISLIALGLGPKRGPAPGVESVLNAQTPSEPTGSDR